LFAAAHAVGVGELADLLGLLWVGGSGSMDVLHMAQAMHAAMNARTSAELDAAAEKMSDNFLGLMGNVAAVAGGKALGKIGGKLRGQPGQPVVGEGAKPAEPVAEPKPAEEPKPVEKPKPAEKPKPVPGKEGRYSPERAQAMFEQQKGRGDIAFKYPRNGCHARAERMCEQIEAAGGKTGKVWAFPKNDADPLHLDTVHDPSGHVEWKYHVAPTVEVVGADGKATTMVIDPSMFDHPVTVAEWTAAMEPKGGGGVRTCLTARGEAPTRADGTKYPGTGYWPGEDPANIHDDAVETMREFKPKEYPPPAKPSSPAAPEGPMG
jgi:hypothetical protein